MGNWGCYLRCTARHEKGVPLTLHSMGLPANLGNIVTAAAQRWILVLGCALVAHLSYLLYTRRRNYQVSTPFERKTGLTRLGRSCLWPPPRLPTSA